MEKEWATGRKEGALNLQAGSSFVFFLFPPSSPPFTFLGLCACSCLRSEQKPDDSHTPCFFSLFAVHTHTKERRCSAKGKQEDKGSLRRPRIDENKKKENPRRN